VEIGGSEQIQARNLWGINVVSGVTEELLNIFLQ